MLGLTPCAQPQRSHVFAIAAAVEAQVPVVLVILRPVLFISESTLTRVAHVDLPSVKMPDGRRCLTSEIAQLSICVVSEGTCRRRSSRRTVAVVGR